MEYEEDDLSEINTSDIDWGEEPDDLSDDGEDQELQSCYENDSEISYARHHEEVGDEPESLEQSLSRSISRWNEEDTPIKYSWSRPSSPWTDYGGEKEDDVSDDVVLKNSGFFKLVEKGNRLNGENIHLTERRTELREFIVSDSCFPLLPWLLTPYQGKPLPLPQTQFNRSHCETTKPGHMELWKLKDTWRIINGVMWRPDRNMLPKMIFVCCLLHNILLDMDDQTLDDSLLYHQHDVVFYDHSSL
ncbi:hypothetical protein Bca4012_031570 [Brassica carinata]